MNRLISAAAFASAIALSATPAFAQDGDILPLPFDLAQVGAASDSSRVATAVAVAPTEEKGESASVISGGGSIVSRYAFSDRYVQIDSPTAQAYASLDLGAVGLANVSADAFVAHGLSTARNWEFDLGFTLHDIKIASGVVGEISVAQYVLANLHDITTIEAKVVQGSVDLSVTHYVVHREPDATKFEVGYSFTPIDRLTLRPLLVFEHGFGLTDQLVGGGEASYSLGGGFALNSAVYTALYEKSQDPRGTVFTFGIGFNF